MKRQTVLSVPLFCAVLYLAAKDFSLLVNVIRGSIPLYSPCRQSSSINVTQVKKLASAKYSERLATLARFCDQYSWSDHLLGRWTNQAPFWKDKLWFSYQHRLAYCHMPKVGSSTWYAHLLTLAGEEAKR